MEYEASLPWFGGWLRLKGTEAAIHVLGFSPEPGTAGALFPGAALLEPWLLTYRQGRDPGPVPVALAPEVTPFQQAVWEAISRIPYGETRTYGELASALGKPGAARAVGQAAGKNPIAILIPCHRVLGAGNRITGYAWGTEIKKQLLSLEGWKLP